MVGGGGGGGGFGRRAPQQPLPLEAPQSYAQVLFPTRLFNYHSYLFKAAAAAAAAGAGQQGQNSGGGGGSLVIPSIAASRANNAKPAPIAQMMLHPCTIFGSEGSTAAAPGVDVAPAQHGRDAPGLRHPPMSMMHPQYFYTPGAPTPGVGGCGEDCAIAAARAAAATTATSTSTSSSGGGRGASGRRVGGASGPQSPVARGPRGGAAARSGVLASSIMTSAVATRVASVLPPELVLSPDQPSTLRIKAVRRKPVEKPVRRGGVVISSSGGGSGSGSGSPRVVGAAVRRASGAKRPRGDDDADVDGGGVAVAGVGVGPARGGSGARSGSEEAAGSAGDTDEVSSISGNDDDDDGGDGFDDGGSGDELTM